MKKSLLILLANFVSFTLFAQDGVSDKEIKIGQSAALSGPAEALGKGMKLGMDAYFKKINDAGGINGKKINLISKDDGYEPDKAIAATKSLLTEDKVFLLIGEVGTPTSKAVLPIVDEHKVPFLAAFTGAEILRNPFNPNVINVRGSYYQEMEKLAAYLVDKKGLKNIACFYQNDPFGQAGLAGIEIALKKRNMELCAKGNYERNTVAVKGALLEIKKGNPEAIVMVGAYKPCAEFIRTAKKIPGLKEALYCNISFVGSEALKEDLGEDGNGTIISQVVRNPWDENEKTPIVTEYREAMKKYFPDQSISLISMEGFMAAKLFSEVVGKMKGEITRENFLTTLHTIGKFDLGGVTLEFSDKDHQGMDEIFLTVIKDGKIVALD